MHRQGRRNPGGDIDAPANPTQRRIPTNQATETQNANPASPWHALGVPEVLARLTTEQRVGKLEAAHVFRVSRLLLMGQSEKIA